MAALRAIRTGDIVRVSIRGREFYASVTGKHVDAEPSTLSIEPIEPGITYRTATARQVLRSWRARGRERADG